ncbi:MAG: hypothetical protein HRT45_07720 [Bdellovibrionales bacterium]|nr:hypothetical protein [Bdellovibrionales bacterium]
MIGRYFHKVVGVFAVAATATLALSAPSGQADICSDEIASSPIFKNVQLWSQFQRPLIRAQNSFNDPESAQLQVFYGGTSSGKTFVIGKYFKFLLQKQEPVFFVSTHPEGHFEGSLSGRTNGVDLNWHTNVDSLAESFSELPFPLHVFESVDGGIQRLASVAPKGTIFLIDIGYKTPANFELGALLSVHPLAAMRRVLLGSGHSVLVTVNGRDVEALQSYLAPMQFGDSIRIHDLNRLNQSDELPSR